NRTVLPATLVDAGGEGFREFPAWLVPVGTRDRRTEMVEQAWRRCGDHAPMLDRDTVFQIRYPGVGSIRGKLAPPSPVSRRAACWPNFRATPKNSPILFWSQSA